MDLVQAVFISSIQRDYGDVRAAARRAVDSLGMRPLMAELAGANPASPQRALLDLVAVADIFLLLVGPRYSKPTEDEFDEARRLGKPILVVRQEGDLKPEQAAFLERVAGGWSGGRFWGSFTDASDVGFAVVQAITNLGARAQDTELAPKARERAAELAIGQRRHGYSGQRSDARVALVPLVADPILDALALEEPGLGEAVADLARGARLVPHSIGITPRVSRAGVSLERAAGGYVGEPGIVTVASDGAIVCEVDIGGDDPLGGMRVDSGRLEEGIRRVGSFALTVWRRVDRREAVQQVAVSVVISDAQNKVLDLPTGATGWSVGMSLPQIVHAPEPPIIVRRAEVDGDELARRIVAEIRRIYVDAGAVAR
jgi:Domain of unknown function (DUF4062)